MSKEGIRADLKKVQAITNRLLPKTTTELRGFFNAAGFLRRLIHGFSGHAAPLYPLTSGGKGAAIRLNKKQVAAFSKLKKALTTAPVVRAFCWSLPAYLRVDPSTKWIGEAYTTTETVSQSVLDEIALTNDEIQVFAAIGFTDKTTFAGEDAGFPGAENPMLLGRLINPIEVETWFPDQQEEAIQIPDPEVAEEGDGADRADRQITRISELNDIDLIAITGYLRDILAEGVALPRDGYCSNQGA
ncbi:hypothetical protein PspLS_11927 [Pyricularia sp. CBS 133598]|nr:hypothetical protein PspLS_11927 [Pyricularia sp. CBS 133598]